MFGYKGNVILSVDSEKLSLTASQKNTDDIRLSALIIKEYAGFQNGNFIDEAELFDKIKEILESLHRKFGIKSKKIYIGVPGEFTCARVKTEEVEISDKVRKSNVAQLLAEGDTFENSAFKSIYSTPVFFEKDSSPYKLFDPVGEVCSTLKAKISYILCESYFINLFDEIAYRLGVRFIYIPLASSDAFYLNKKHFNFGIKEAILINTGYMSTSVLHIQGSSVLSMYSFSLGSGSISGGLTVAFDSPLSHGIALMDKLNLNLHPKDDDMYAVYIDGNTHTYPIKKVNAAATSKITMIAQYTAAALVKMDLGRQLKDNSLPVFITGSQLCRLQGAKDYFISELGIDRLETAEASVSCLKSAETFSLAAITDMLCTNKYNTKKRVG